MSAYGDRKVVVSMSAYDDRKVVYSKHPNTEPSGIRMVTFRTLFVSSFQMVKTRWWPNTIRKPDKFVRFLNGKKKMAPKVFLTSSLDRFIAIKDIFFHAKTV